MRKVIICLICSILFIPLINAEELKLAENAKGVVLMEASTGEIIYARGENEKLTPASMTKMMSMLLILESIESGVINWDDMVRVSENASSMGGSQILLETGEEMSVSDLFKGIAVASGNDAVVALAEKVAGTEDEFVRMMNEKAHELGLTNTNFKNPHGLDAANHYSSAKDMAIIARELVKHEKVFEYTSIYEDYLRKGTDREFWLVNTNKLVRFYAGVDGLKTGYTVEAGYCLTATAKRGNMRLIAVVMGEPDSKTRNAEVSSMLDYGFASYEIETLLSEGSIIKRANIRKSKQENVDIILMDNVNVLNKKGTPKKSATYDVELDEVKMPIKKGDIVGNLAVNIDNNVVMTVPLTVSNDIEECNLIELYLKNLKQVITGT